MYVARHTCATMLKRGGVAVAQISEVLGHGSERTTQIYLKAFSNDELDTVVASLYKPKVDL